MRFCVLVLATVLGSSLATALYSPVVRPTRTRAAYSRSNLSPSYYHASYDTSYNRDHQQRAGYGSSGYNTYDSYGHGYRDSSHYGHSHQCTCRIGQVCKEDKYGRPYCQSVSHAAGGGYGYGTKGRRCMNLKYPTSCLRPRIRGAITRYAFQNGRCMPIVASNVAPWCRPVGRRNNIFRSRYACEDYCHY